MNFSKKAFKIVFTATIIIFIIFPASTVHAELTLDAVYPTLGELGKDLEVTLTGDGFDANSRIFMYLDSGNTRAIIGSVPTPGSAYAVTVLGTMAYVADGNSGLQIIDVSDPESPQLKPSVPTPGTAYGVTVVGTMAYVADGDGGLQVIDVSNPDSPQSKGSALTPGTAYGVAVVGTMAYVADGDGGLQVIDVSNPDSPQPKGSVPTPGFANGVTVVGTMAYVADHDAGLQVIDVSDPDSPQIKGSEPTPGLAYGVTVAGTTAYVADDYIGLRVIDVSNPEKPKTIGFVDTPGSARSVTVVDTTAYVADHRGGLQVFDVSNPDSPQAIGSVAIPGYAFGVTVVGSTAYVADEDAGLQVIDVSNPTRPQIIGSVATPETARGITVVGTTAYVSDGKSGLQVIDVSNPDSPQIIGDVPTPGYARGVAVVGTMAYVADQEGGLQVIDISDPENPGIIGSRETPGSANGITVVGALAYMADGSNGLQVIDVSNPDSPQLRGSANTPGSAYGVMVIGNLAYVAYGSSGLQVIDISDPENPGIIGSRKTPGSANGITVVGTLAYMADGSNGLQVIDVSNPDSPQLRGSANTPGSANGITVVDTTAYVSDGNSGLQAIDISNPDNPQIIGYADTLAYAFGVTVVGTTAYLADSVGPVIVPVPTEIKPVTVDNASRIKITLSSPKIVGHYTLRVINETESDELVGAVSFTEDLQILYSKAIIVAGGGPDAPGEIWEETKKSANKAYDTLIYEGYDHDSIYYLTGEIGNPFRDVTSIRSELEWAINNWASDASELVIFFVDHGLPDEFVIFDDGAYSQKLNVDELDDWLDDLQQSMVGPITFIYDACHSGTFASKLNPPIGKDRIVISGASDEPAYFRGDDSFSFQFWEQIFLRDGNLGSAFSKASDIIRGYQTALINANGNSLTNEAEDITKANDIVIRRGQPIYVKPAPTIDNVVDSQTLTDSNSAVVWVNDVRGAESVWAKIIPPDINPDADGVPITDLPSIQLQDTDSDGTYDGQYHGFTTEGTYTIITSAQTSQEIYSYVQDAMIDQIIKSSPVYASITQMNGAQKISADSYEEDDTDLQANVITLGDLDVQAHNFHDLGDVDWVKFYGLSGQTYTIKAGNINVICDVVIELFDSNGNTRLVGPWNEAGDGEDEVLEWTCTRDDVYYVKLSNDNATFGENCKYDLKLYRPIGPLAGFITGIAKNAITQQTLGDIRIKTNLNQSALSLPDGTYLLVHPPGTFTVTAQAAGYNTKSYSGVKVEEGVPETRKNIDLVPSSTDLDNDGILDSVEYASSCLDFNDADTDNDGLADGEEDKNYNGIIDPGETDPCDQDTDGDQMPDGWEVQYNLNPLLDDASEDADGDGYSNLYEYKEHSDPSSTDTDKDGILDTIEYASSCLNVNDADTDNDGLVDGEEDKNYNGIIDPGETDPCDQDTDGDQMPDGWEVQYNLNPLVDDSSEDADGDGYTNLQEFIGRNDPTDPFSPPQTGRRLLLWVPLLLFDD